MNVLDDCDILAAEGFDSAIVGSDMESGRIIYAESLCIKILQERDGMSEEQALEFMDYNVYGAYVGEGKPIFLTEYIHE